MNNKILNEVENIVSFIKESDTYKDYIFLKEKLSNNETAMSLINEIKTIQKQLVKKEVNNEDIKDLDNLIKEKEEELNRIPLYIEYINKQEQLNDLYQDIKQRLDDYFYNQLN